MEDKVVWDRLGRLDDQVRQQQDQLDDHESRLPQQVAQPVDESTQRVAAAQQQLAAWAAQEAVQDEEDRRRGYRLVWGVPTPL